MSAPLLTCTMCLCASLQAQDAAGFICLRLDGRNDRPQKQAFQAQQHVSVSCSTNAFTAVVHHRRTNLYNCLYTTGLYSQTVHTHMRRSRRPTGAAEGRRLRLVEGFTRSLQPDQPGTLHVLYRQVLFLLKTDFFRKQMKRREGVCVSVFGAPKSCCNIRDGLENTV